MPAGFQLGIEMSQPLVEHRSGKNRSSKRGKQQSTCTNSVERTFSAEAQAVVEADQITQPRPSQKRSQTQEPKETSASQPSRPRMPKHPSSQTCVSPDKRSTPSKAYAGPTFHSSPAASSLPMPSFYSKSLPAMVAGSSPTNAQLDGPGHVDSETETPRHGDLAEKSKEPSPLDFMFEAARRARQSPRPSPYQSPEQLANRAPPSDRSTGTRLSHSALVTSSESVFPFELDGNGGAARSIGPAFATPYQERMDALRSSRTQSATSAQVLDEEECREKSEALKRLLNGGSPLRSSSDPTFKSYHSLDQALQDRRGSVEHRESTTMEKSPTRFRDPQVPMSGPTSTTSNGVYPESDYASRNSASSYLRHEYLPENSPARNDILPKSHTPLRTVMSAHSRLVNSVSGHNAYNTQEQQVYSQEKSSNLADTTYSAQKLEDDLRRVLKLGPHATSASNA